MAVMGRFLKHLTSAGAERWRICNHLYREERKMVENISESVYHLKKKLK